MSEASEAKFAAALTGWESATVKNLDPLSTDSEALWAAIRAASASRDATRFSIALYEMAWKSNDVGPVLRESVAQLETLIAAHAATE